MAAVEVDDGVLLKFAQKLASNEKKFRDRAVKKLKKWLQSRSNTGFTEVDLLKLWKGLHYCMWMSDKPLVQEELAATLSDLIHAFENDESSLVFIDTFIQTEAREWYGIDKFRIDKFMMLVRKFLHQSFVVLKQKKWNKKVIQQMMAIFSKGVINAESDSIPDGLKLHFADIYVDELQKVAVGEMSSKKIQLFLEPYCVMLTQVKSKAVFESVLKNIFMKFVDQVLDEEFEEEEEDEEENEEENQEKVPKLEVDFGTLADRLFELSSSKSCLGRNRKDIYDLVKVLRDLAVGNVPEPETESEGEEPLGEADIKKAMQRLGSFENNLMKKTGNSKKKKRKKTSAEDDEDDEVPKSKKQKLATKEKKKKSSQENGDIRDKKKKSLEKKKAKKTENGVTKMNSAESKKVKKMTAAHALMNGSVATSTPLSDSSNKKSLKKTNKSPEVEQNLFQGGFFDEDEEEITNKQVEKKSKTSKKVDKETENENVLKLAVSDEVNGIEEEVSNEKMTSKNIENKKDAKKRRQSLPTNLKEKKSSEAEENLFAGGFFDYDDDVKTNSSSGKSKKDAKKRRKSMPATIEKHEISNDKPLKKKSRKSLELLSSGDNEMTNGVDFAEIKLTASDKKKKQSAFKVVSESPKDDDAPQKSGKKKKNKTPQKGEKSEWDQPLEDGEVEIFVASKKHQKKKGDGNLSLNTSELNGSKNVTPKKKKGSDFANFEEMLKTPPAFVRKAIDKTSPRQSTGKKTKVSKLKDTPSELTASGKKKVFFAMNKNKAQDFNDSLVMSPVVAFDPEIRPDQGILKTPTSSPASKKSPRKKDPMQKLVFQKRAKAADFF